MCVDRLQSLQRLETLAQGPTVILNGDSKIQTARLFSDTHTQDLCNQMTTPQIWEEFWQFRQKHVHSLLT